MIFFVKCLRYLELESKMTEYKRDSGAAVILNKYEDKLREMKMVLQGYADKLECHDSKHPLLKHQTL